QEGPQGRTRRGTQERRGRGSPPAPAAAIGSTLRTFEPGDPAAGGFHHLIPPSCRIGRSSPGGAIHRGHGARGRGPVLASSPSTPARAAANRGRLPPPPQRARERATRGRAFRPAPGGTAISEPSRPPALRGALRGWRRRAPRRL